MKTFNEEEAKDLSPLIGRIQDFLMKKSLFEMKKQDQNNITSLGGVSFFFKYDNEDTYLCYTQHPDNWNERAIMNDIEEYERYVAIQKGVYIEH